MNTKSEKFEVGDHVWSPHFGEGIITGIDYRERPLYPIAVEWTKEVQPYHGHHDFFMLNGQYAVALPDSDYDIVSMEGKPKDDEGVVERMEDALSKKVDDAINPSHYRVEGLPESIDIINHLMHREQYEGFLWGNILKYAYRYGLKGDKAETAGKIAWYAQKLKELGECESK